ncbi:MAG: DUF2652 domain-containing protein [Saprospiraceae bacterium]|nr:DUF2652 domain-containing protein [Saprospiraceae bacterium]
MLETILSANEIGLVLSEIEGDALLMYRRGKAPTCQELLSQIQKMYINFHAHLKKYETQRICSCGACIAATDLELKFVTHYGELAETVINNRPGLFGPAVIAAHRLLKNKVDSESYGLFSSELMSACPSWFKLNELAWGETSHLEEEYDFGKVIYSFLELEKLKERVPEPEPEDFSIPNATKKIFETEGVVEAPIEITFNVLSDYYFRSEFVVGQLANDMQNHKIFQHGSIHRCLLGKSVPDPVFVTHDFNFNKKKITFVESDKINSISVVWILQAIDKDSTHITHSSFMKPHFLKGILFSLFMKKNVTKDWDNSWPILKEYCKKLATENKVHPNSIVLPKEVKQMTND